MVHTKERLKELTVGPKFVEMGLLLASFLNSGKENLGFAYDEKVPNSIYLEFPCSLRLRKGYEWNISKVSSSVTCGICGSHEKISRTRVKKSKTAYQGKIPYC